MPAAAHLNCVAVLFASGSVERNQAALLAFAAAHPSLPLVIVAEFQPDAHEWIPWHVHRTRHENEAAIRAALHGRTVQGAAMVLGPGTALGPMRLAALRIAGAALIAYDEDLRRIGLSDLPAFWARSLSRAMSLQFAAGGRARKWLRRIANPSEAEIPVRARFAQAYGAIASHLRATSSEAPLPGYTPLQPGVTVVIPSRDGRTLLAEMLPHLAPQVTRGEIVVVDNGSSDGTAEWLAEEFASIRVVSSEKPLSFAKAINAGLREARFDRLLMLNNDMVVSPGFIAALLDAFRRVPELFCATAQIFFPPGVRREETGKAVWRQESPLDFPVRCDEPVEGEDLTWVLYGSGGCSLFHTARLREIGGVAEVYEPAYVEDMDFGYAAWKRGWPTVYCAAAKAEHRHRATTSRFFTPRELDFFVERNYLRFLIHAIGAPALFQRLWSEAIRRLQLMAMRGNEAALDVLRRLPAIGALPVAASGHLSEEEILALGSGDSADFPGRAEALPNGQTIVIASPYLPFPLSHGGAVRIYNLLRATAAEYNLVLVAFCDRLAPPPPEILALCREVVLVRRHGTHYRKSTPRPDMVEEFESVSFRAVLRQTCARWKPPIVQLEFTWMAQYADTWRAARTILVEHDITFDLHRQLALTGNTGEQNSWEQRQQLEKWERFERNAWRNVDCVVTMSARDRQTVEGAKLVAEIPNGVDCDRFQPVPSVPEPRRLLFIGSFAHLPNLLALEYLQSRVWPLLRAGYTLHVIAGARHEYYREFYGTRARVDLDAAGIEVEGFVSDVRQAYTRAELVLAPLVASAGTNIKVLEAMAMGKVVVSTPAGVNGIPVSDGVNAIVREGPEAMAEAIEALSADAAKRRAIGLAARQFSLQFDWNQVGIAQSRLYAALVAENTS